MDEQAWHKTVREEILRRQESAETLVFSSHTNVSKLDLFRVVESKDNYYFP